jgi:hypothetical protein
LQLRFRTTKIEIICYSGSTMARRNNAFFWFSEV